MLGNPFYYFYDNCNNQLCNHHNLKWMNVCNQDEGKNSPFLLIKR